MVYHIYATTSYTDVVATPPTSTQSHNGKATPLRLPTLMSQDQSSYSFDQPTVAALTDEDVVVPTPTQEWFQVQSHLSSSPILRLPLNSCNPVAPYSIAPSLLPLSHCHKSSTMSSAGRCNIVIDLGGEVWSPIIVPAGQKRKSDALLHIIIKKKYYKII